MLSQLASRLPWLARQWRGEGWREFRSNGIRNPRAGFESADIAFRRLQVLDRGRSGRPAGPGTSTGQQVRPRWGSPQHIRPSLPLRLSDAKSRALQKVEEGKDIDINMVPILLLLPHPNSKPFHLTSPSTRSLFGLLQPNHNGSQGCHRLCEWPTVDAHCFNLLTGQSTPSTVTSRNSPKQRRKALSLPAARSMSTSTASRAAEVLLPPPD